MTSTRQRATAHVLRRYPLYSGCGTLANHRHVRRIAPDTPEVAWAQVPGGLEIAAPLDDYVGRAVFYAGDLDRKLTWLLRRVLRPGDRAVDIGANLGLVTFAMAALVGSGGRVDAVEPNPDMVDKLRDSIIRNRAAQVTVHPVAVGAQPGELVLSVPRGHAGSASFDPARRYADSVDVRVPVSTVDVELDDAPTRVLKVDVEGFEGEVLAGAGRWLNAARPTVVVLEDNAADGQPGEAVAALEDAGYRLYGMPRRLLRPALVRYAPQVGNDVVAVDRDARGVAEALEV